MGKLCQWNVILPDPINLQRMVNRTRASKRPKHPTNLLFDLDMPNIHKNLRGNILYGLGERENRDLIFATKKSCDYWGARRDGILMLHSDSF